MTYSAPTLSVGRLPASSVPPPPSPLPRLPTVPTQTTCSAPTPGVDLQTQEHLISIPAATVLHPTRCFKHMQNVEPQLALPVPVPLPQSPNWKSRNAFVGGFAMVLAGKKEKKGRESRQVTPPSPYVAPPTPTTPHLRSASSSSSLKGTTGTGVGSVGLYQLPPVAVSYTSTPGTWHPP